MGVGGADQQLLAAAPELRARGHEVLLVSLTPLGPMGLEARQLGIPVESLNMPRGVPDPRGLLKLLRLIRAWRPDVLHSHMVHANIMARAARLLVRVPAMISTIHNVEEGGRLRMAIYRLSNALVDQVTIVSQTAADRFISDRIVPQALVRVIPNGVNTERFRRLPPGTRESMRQALGLEPQQFTWIAVGRFELPKDYPTMIHAFSKVREQSPSAVLLIVGRGALQTETESLVQSLSLAGNVRFLGVRNDVAELMSAADGYVMSSAWEGMPIVLLEAAAAGLPIVATSVGGNPEVVVDQESGFLVSPRSPDALATSMLQLAALPEERRRAMGDRGREHVQTRYGLSRMVQRWEDLYREVLTRNRQKLEPAVFR